MRRNVVEPVQVGLGDQRGDEVPDVLLGDHAPHRPRPGEGRVVQRGPDREVALDVGVRASRERLDGLAVAIDIVGPGTREHERG